MWDAAKAVQVGKCIALNAYTRKEGRTQVNILSSTYVCIKQQSLKIQELKTDSKLKGHVDKSQ